MADPEAVRKILEAALPDMVADVIQQVECRFCSHLAFFEGDPLRITEQEVPTVVRTHGIDAYPHCMVSAHPIISEFNRLREANPSAQWRESFKTVIHTRRRCDGWESHNIGESPQAALRRYQEMKLEKERRAFEKKLQNDANDFQTEIFKTGQRTQTTMVKIAAAQALLAVVAIIIGGVATVFSVRCTDSEVRVIGSVPVVTVTPFVPDEEAP